MGLTSGSKDGDLDEVRRGGGEGPLRSRGERASSSEHGEGKGKKEKGGRERERWCCGLGELDTKRRRSSSTEAEKSAVVASMLGMFCAGGGRDSNELSRQVLNRSEEQTSGESGG